MLVEMLNARLFVGQKATPQKKERKKEIQN